MQGIIGDHRDHVDDYSTVFVNSLDLLAIGVEIVKRNVYESNQVRELLSRSGLWASDIDVRSDHIVDRA